ncbi:diguanylate cyclase [Mesorhizobium sp. ANAO-SY3R2]|uniref:diguanylate cyclase n=1 Tax=Mesorhizobium sp. ANAO-SY3R2 TaxID=3166644 RepID=UPI0036705735
MDNSYLLLATLPLVSAILGVTFLFLWRRHRQSVHLLNWSLMYACAVLGSSIGVARLFLENSAPFSFTANALLVGVAFFAVRGATLRHAGRSGDAIMVPIYLATIVGGVWFGFVEPSVIGRGTVSSVGAAAMFLIAAGTVWKARDLDRVDQLVVLTFVLTAATLIGRLVVSYLHEGPIQSEAEVMGSFWSVSLRVFSTLSWFAMAVLFLLQATKDLMKDLAAQSLTDPLTGVYNRRGFFAVAERLMRDTTPAAPAALLICDIDHFKGVNDTFGHRVGDTVIQGLAEVMQEAAKDLDCTIGRLGGEEFVAFLPATNFGQGRAIAEDICKSFTMRLHVGIPPPHIITVSIGVTGTSGDESLDAVIERADRALYRAKGEGRNRVAGAALPFPADDLPRAATTRRQPTDSKIAGRR